ncbi:MAG: hypothetical protein K5663_12145 [Clostridiales bacterium]|nr:hypothetical protein [Clostridiales bacterium]
MFSLRSVLPALLMLAGVCELISECTAKLDRVLPIKRLYRGYAIAENRKSLEFRLRQHLYPNFHPN